MRARYPDIEGHVERDGVQLGYEVYGNGETTVLLMPTWTIVHARFWKMQIPYLSRFYRVIAYDGPGNGRSDRVTDPKRYSADAYADDALAVLDQCGADRAVVVGLSLGAGYAVRLARRAPDRVLAIAMIGPAIPLTPPSPERASISERFAEPYPPDVTGWGKYNLAYWHDHHRDFTQFFFEQCFVEAHSTKPIEDTVGWAADSGPDVLEAEALKQEPDEDWADAVASIACPLLVVHGTRDRISPHARGAMAAELADGTLLSMEGSGHIPNVRDPVKFNLALRDFIERVA